MQSYALDLLPTYQNAIRTVFSLYMYQLNGLLSRLATIYHTIRQGMNHDDTGPPFFCLPTRNRDASKVLTNQDTVISSSPCTLLISERERPFMLDQRL